MDLLDEDFEWATSKVLEIADLCCAGRVVSVLEGGYGTYDKPRPATRATRATKSDAGTVSSM
jgi:acetoin utilization deacetylase AcuC-like enzyme